MTGFTIEIPRHPTGVGIVYGQKSGAKTAVALWDRPRSVQNGYVTWLREAGITAVTRPPKAIVEKKRTVHTYAELWHAAGYILEAGEREPKGSSWQYLSSLVLMAFAFEAYLNHVGVGLLRCWNDVEQLPPLSKFKLLCEILKVDFLEGAGARPVQTLSELLVFRNSVAHGKTEPIEKSEQRDINDKIDAYLGERLLLDWQRRIQTADFAKRVREDVEIILRRLHDARPEPKEMLFAFGAGFHSATAPRCG